MDVKEAARAALEYVSDLFAEEQIGDLGLEEVEMDDRTGQWRITVGFSRPWERTGGAMSVISGQPRPRSYKVLTIDSDGTVVSLKNR